MRGRNLLEVTKSADIWRTCPEVTFLLTKPLSRRTLQKIKFTAFLYIKLWQFQSLFISTFAEPEVTHRSGFFLVFSFANEPHLANMLAEMYFTNVDWWILFPRAEEFCYRKTGQDFALPSSLVTSYHTSNFNHIQRSQSTVLDWWLNNLTTRWFSSNYEFPSCNTLKVFPTARAMLYVNQKQIIHRPWLMVFGQFASKFGNRARCQSAFVDN